jgi:hypothetical protein
VPDDDADGDGTADCIDACPGDPAKMEPGICGCGVSDDDTDGDGTADCIDACASDPNKTGPGICGCGVPDSDSDGDGTADCLDACPDDAGKTEPGICGCGTSDEDSDGDGTVDCNDDCPDDPDKVNSGQCGCGVPDTDRDGDHVADCVDNCMSIWNEYQEDGDLDGIGDVCDNCPMDPNPAQADSDGDGIGDVCEPSCLDITYEGDTIRTTDGERTVTVTLIATLRDDQGTALDIDGELVTFTLIADGAGPIEVPAVTTDGRAEAAVSLAPGVYSVEIATTICPEAGQAVVVVYTPSEDFATGGGWFIPEDDGLNTHPNIRVNFGFNARPGSDLPSGHLEFRYTDGYIDLNSTSIEELVITDGKIVQFKGWASVNREEGYWFSVEAIDDGNPGVGADSFDLKVWAPGASQDDDPMERAGGLLRGGNITVHREQTAATR